MPRFRRLRLVGVLAAALAVLTACTPTVSMHPAPYANDPLCAEVMVRLPDAVAGKDRVWTNAQATGAWGTPAVILMTCGLAAPAPTADLPCSLLEGVDWLVDTEDAPYLRMTTYGRQPAVQVYVNTVPEEGGVSSNEALRGLASAVRQIPATGRCINPNELPPMPTAPPEEPEEDAEPDA